MSKLLLLIFLCIISKYESARILAVFPTPSISHQVTFRPLMQELVKRGHEIVVITTDPVYSNDKRPENYTEIDVHDISYKMWRDEVIPLLAKGDKNDLTNIMYKMMTRIFETQMKFEEVQNIIQKKTKSFDLILIEAFLVLSLGFSHIYNVPVIEMSSFLPLYPHLKIIGAPDHPVLYPAVGRQKLDNLSVLEKLQELYNHFRIEREIDNLENYFDKSMQRTFGSDVPPLKELYNNVDMLFLNCFPIWDSNRPVPPSVQYLGGIHVKPPKELPQDLKSYLDSSKRGVIYISFGTNVNPSSLPPEKIQTMINVLSHLPYDVLWKWDKDELPGRSKNIRISKWLPQSDLLKHPNIKLFVTQGGLQSTDEAILAGVPLLGIPMLGDQWYNVAMYLRHKIGVHVEMKDLNEENFKAAIDTLSNDDSYRRNMQNFRSTLYDQPQTPLERAVWWTEHVLRHGGARHLRSPAANMPWTQYYEIELVTYLLLSAISGLLLVVFIIFKVRKLVLSDVNTSIKLKSS